jgi:hypothetical protein
MGNKEAIQNPNLKSSLTFKNKILININHVKQKKQKLKN